MSEVIKKVWSDSDGALYLSNPAVEMGKLDNGVYRLEQDMFERLYLRKIYSEFTFDYKIYGLETSFVNRVLKTYENTTGNLGILLNGVRGTGKTVSSKIIANKLNQPTVVIDVPFNGTVDFLSSIPQDITVFLDEYEKTFNESSTMLTIMDGVLNSDNRRVFLLTTNDLFVDRNLLQRPSRIRYMKSYEDLSPRVVEEIVDDFLMHTEFKTDMLKFISCLELITVDVVKAIIQETNIHKESPYDFAELFNVKKNTGKFDIFMLDDRGKRTPFLKNANCWPMPKFEKENEDMWLDFQNTYLGEIQTVLSPTAIVITPRFVDGKPMGFVKPITLEFVVAETRHINYAFAYGNVGEESKEELIGETIMALIDQADDLDTQGKQFKNGNFTIEGLDKRTANAIKVVGSKYSPSLEKHLAEKLG